MATSASTWTVLIVSANGEFDAIFRRTPETTLAAVMQAWRDKFRLFGNWLFTSDNGEIEYADDQMTLQDVGESTPNSQIVTLRVIHSSTSKENRFIEIFVFIDGVCHQLYVKPNYRLDRVLPRVAGGKISFEYRGQVLNLKQTVRQAGLKHKAVICESSIRVSVKLSSKNTKSFRISKEAVVSELKAKVAAHEQDDFTFKYRGRTVELHENVKSFKGQLEVSTSTFVVHLDDGRRFSWKAASGKVKFQDFVAKLFKESEVDRRILENTVYECCGCGRRVWKSEEEYQHVGADCCRQKSLTLRAKLSTDYKGIRTVRDQTNTRSNLKKKVYNQPRVAGSGVQTHQVVTASRAVQVDPMKNVKLLVLYYSNEFKFNSIRPEREEKGKYLWLEGDRHIKCQIDLLVPQDGMVQFDDIRDALAPFFTRGRIQEIYQVRGVGGGREAALVTSLPRDEVPREEKKRRFCDCHGEEFTWAEVKPQYHFIDSGEKFLICGGGRRTVVEIFP